MTSPKDVTFLSRPACCFLEMTERGSNHKIIVDKRCTTTPNNAIVCASKKKKPKEQTSYINDVKIIHYYHDTSILTLLS